MTAPLVDEVCHQPIDPPALAQRLLKDLDHSLQRAGFDAPKGSVQLDTACVSEGPQIPGGRVGPKGYWLARLRVGQK